MSIPDNVSDIAKIQKDLLWGMYLDVRTHSRHNEILRSNAVNFVLAMASALIAVITFDKQIDRYDLPLCFIVGVMGLIGTLFSASFTELYFRNRNRAGYFLQQLDNSFFTGKAEVTLAQIEAKADEEHRKTGIYRWSRRITGSTQNFWLVPPLVVLIIGILLTLLAVRGLQSI
jgi:hypothetical protein